MSARDSFTRAAEAFNRRDHQAFAALYAVDAIVRDPIYPQPLTGRDAIEQDMVDFFRAFSDARFTVGRVLEDGQTVAGEFSISGTHTGPLALPDGEIPATGKPLTFEGAAFSLFNAQGEIVEEHRYYDLAGQLAQLGLSQ